MNLKRAALDQLATYLATQVPSLAGRVSAVQADEEDQQSYPFLAILPTGKFVLDPFQQDEVDTTDYTDKEVVNVGALRGPVELRLYAHTPYEREELGQQVIDAFHVNADAPGVAVVTLPSVTVGGFTTTYGPLAAFTLEGEQWQEEMVFSKKRFAFFDVEATVPVLVMVQQAYDITTLEMAFTSDLESPTPTLDETFTVADDGSFTKD